MFNGLWIMDIIQIQQFFNVLGKRKQLTHYCVSRMGITSFQQRVPLLTEMGIYSLRLQNIRVNETVAQISQEFERESGHKKKYL